jgi:hypothetical protein
MTRFKPIVIDLVRERRARMLDELRRIENGEVPGVTAMELEMMRDKVRELDNLLREHTDPLSH